MMGEMALGVKPYGVLGEVVGDEPVEALSCGDIRSASVSAQKWYARGGESREG